MYTITFTCETITPMFLSGADGTTPELRAPSIKGALRFWWRAMHGHLAKQKDGEWDHTRLLKEDEKLFGGVNDGGKKSSVLVRVLDLENENDLIQGNEIKLFCERNELKGLAYLFYILVNNQQRDRDGFRSLKFKLALSSQNHDDLKKTVACFWLFVYLGGLGSRARRGAGCIQVTGIVDNEHCLLGEEKKPIISFLPDEANSVVSFYTENYKKCISILQKPNTPENYSKDDDKYSTLTNNEIHVSTDSFNSWQLALDDIGSVMREVRSLYEKYENRPFELGDLPLKAVFGLPIQIRNTKPSSRNPRGFMGYYVDLLNENTQRRASPLVISIARIKIQETFKYHWVLTYLDGEFVEEGNNVVVRNSKKQIHKDRNREDFSWKIISDDYELIDAFLDKLSKTKITI